MNGISRAISSQVLDSFLEIDIEKDFYYIASPMQRFHRTLEDTVLEKFTYKVLDSFRALERAVDTAKSEEQLTLSPEQCGEALVSLASWGMGAYGDFFKEKKARDIIAKRMHLMGDAIPRPTFCSDHIPFPWEVLYEGENYEELYDENISKDRDRNMLWGFRYALAHSLTPDRDIGDYPWEQPLPLDMLFCLNHHLSYSYKQERPDVEKLVSLSHQHSKFSLFSSSCVPIEHNPAKNTGEILIKYLDEAYHNMVHFACHCKTSDFGDTLLFSHVSEEGTEMKSHIMKLETYAFGRVRGQFQRQPLVFLNACKSAGGADDLGKTFNFPKAFIDHGAAAVIATACPVPDIFAASFARVFYEFFLRGKEISEPETKKKRFLPLSIGEALLETRWYFLEKHNNPLGLAYGLYSPAHYRLAQPLSAGGVH